MKRLHIFLLLVVLQAKYNEVLSCYSGTSGGGGGGKKTDAERYKDVYKDIRAKYANYSEIPWEMTDAQIEEYGKWLDDYKKIRDERRYNETQGPAPPGMNMPGQWHGYGTGHTGQSPPPWAYHKGNYGRANFCFYHRSNGNEACGQKWIRWGFNRYTQKCVKFIYYSCGGNANNFVTEKRCKEACIDPAMSNCCKYGEYIEY